MAFSAVQLFSFFSNIPHMALYVVAHDRLGKEGFEFIKDSADFYDNQLYQAVNNMRTSIPNIATVLCAQDIVVFPRVAPIPVCILSAKCALRLKLASLDFHYYHTICSNRTPANMNYTHVLRTFYIEWEAVIKLSKETKNDVPQMFK